MRIAIIRLSAFGDVVIASSMLAGLKLFYNCSIEWFIDERFSGIIEDSPYIYKIHSLPFKKLLKSAIGILKIKKYCDNCGYYDIVIDMQGLIKSALIGKFLKTQYFVGFSIKSARESLASIFYTHRVKIPYDENILKRNFKVIFEYLPNTKINLKKVLTVRNQSLGVNHHVLNKNLIKIFIPTSHIQQIFNFFFVLEASIHNKMYPVEKYAILAHYLHTFLGIQKCRFYFTWHDNEEMADSLAMLLAKQSISAYKLPKLNFNTLKFCIAQMDCVIGGDTGVTHLAWAMGKHCITLYGNSSTTRSKNMRNTKLQRVLLGNPYVVSKSNSFEISSIDPQEIFKVFKYEIMNSRGTKN